MKKLITVLLPVLLLVLAGCGKAPEQLLAGKDNTTEALMDMDALMTIAYDHAGVSAGDVYDVDADWEWQKDAKVLELDFEANGVEYAYRLDAKTGQILHSFFDAETTQPAQQELTPEQAKTIALEHAALTPEDVTGLRAEKDYDDRRYEVDFYADGYEYEYEIDLYTGDILKSEKERD